MGTVTSVATTNSITATKYNDLVNEVNAIIDTPSGTYVNDGTEGTIQGYGSSITQGSTVTDVDKITANDWNTVSGIVNSVTGHRTGTVGSLPTLTSSEKITAAKYNAIATAHNTNYNDRFTVDSTNTSLTTATTGTLAAGWNGQNSHVFNIVFASVNDKLIFFNTGGSLRITASATYTGAEAKSIDWRNMIDNLEQVDIFGDSITYTNSSYAGSTKRAAYEGWYNLDSLPNGTPDTDIYKFTSNIDGGDAVYNENYVRYRFRRVNDTTYSIFLDFFDEDIGDKTGTGPAVDEDVQTVVTTTVDVITPTGTFAATTPTFSSNGSTVGFSATY
jgi:hypothetical protein